MKAVRIACMVLGAPALAACSLLYNPNNLPEVMVDAPTIVMVDNLGPEAVGPQELLEGQGTGGSRPAILVIQGHDIAQDATVALVAVDAQGPAPMIEVDNAHAVRSLSGTGIAVPVTLPIDTSRGATGKCEGADQVALTVQVTQMGSSAPITVPLAGKVSLCNLPELDMPISDSALLKSRYSRVNVSTTLTFTSSATPVIIRAVGSIDLGDVNANASNQQPGPGGAGGGAAQKMGEGRGGGNPGSLVDLANLGLLVAGSGGGFGGLGGQGAPSNPGGAVSGDELIVSFASNQSSGGGGGGNNPGGGGGGTVELTAGGTLKTGAISANGGGGGDGAALAGAGGGGSGGAIVLRSGAPATFIAISAAGGPGGASGPAGGNGASGRLRYDVPSPVGTPAMPMARRKGVAFLESNLLVTTDRQQAISVISEVSADTSKNIFDVFVFDAAKTNTAMMTITFVTPSMQFSPTLNKGYNHVCVTPQGHNPLVDLESTNCIDIAYVP